jgi:hypothetical protein
VLGGVVAQAKRRRTKHAVSVRFIFYFDRLGELKVALSCLWIKPALKEGSQCEAR